MKRVIKLLIIASFIFIITNVEALTLNNVVDINLVMAKMVGCGDTVGIPSGLPKFVSNIINIIKIATPIILIIMGMIDFAKAVVSNDEKAMKESQSRFIRRVIGGILVFVVVVVIQLIFNMIGTNSTNNMASCINCFVNNECTEINNTNMACYQCNSDSSLYLWINSNPGNTSACPAGYHEINLTEKECKSRYKDAACYQCNSPSNLYEWGTGTVVGCPSGTHKRTDITTAEKCNSSLGSEDITINNNTGSNNNSSGSNNTGSNNNNSGSNNNNSGSNNNNSGSNSSTGSNTTNIGCYQCNSPSNLYSWGTGTVAGCSSGTHKRNDITSQSKCTNSTSSNTTKACYQCNSPSNLYSWGTGTVAGCSSGTHIRNDITSPANCTANACYQCNSPSNLYEWGTGTVAGCSSGTHVRNDKTKENCHS